MTELKATIEEIIRLVPFDEATLRRGLESVLGSLIFTAPEAIRERESDVGQILHQHLGRYGDLTDWRRAVADAFLDHKGRAVKPDRPEDFVVRKVLHAGEGPVRERGPEEVIGAHIVSRALETVARDEIRADVGSPTFDDAGSESITLYYAVDDFQGNRTFHRVTARLEMKFECESIPAPVEGEVRRG